MARANQIIPGYKSPHVAKYINDYSQYTELTPELNMEVDTSIKTVVVGGADRGPDNKFVRFNPNTWNIFQLIYGTPRFKKFGQSCLYPYYFLNGSSELAQPNTTVWYMRVMPDDAAYANAILVAKFGVQTVSELVTNPDHPADPPTTTTHKEFQIMYNVESYTPNTSTGDLGCLYDEGTTNSLAYAEKALENLSVDGNGWYTLPLMTLRAVGHGDYGNKLSFRFEKNFVGEQDTITKQYILTTLDNFDLIQRSKSYVGSLVNAELQHIGVTTFEDVVLTYGDEANIYVKSYIENVNYIYQQYMAFLATISPSTITDPDQLEIYNKSLTLIPETFDPIFATFIASETSPYMLRVIDTPLAMYNNPNTPDPRYTSAVNIKEGVGVPLQGGTEGAFDRSKTPANTVYEDYLRIQLNKEYVNAFNGLKDKRILSTSRIPYDFIFDADYMFTPDDDSTNVKRTMYRLNNTRCRNPFDAPDEGCGSLLFLDAGTQLFDIATTASNTKDMTNPNYRFNSNTELLQLIQSYSVFANRLTSKEFQHFTMYDPFTNKRIVVTSIINAVMRFIPNLQNNGLEKPFANQRAPLTSAVRGTFVEPVLQDIDMDCKDELVAQRFNYYEYGYNETLSRMNQETSQVISSALLEENNMVVLNSLMNGVEKYNRSILFDHADAAARAQFTADVEKMYGSWAGTKLQKFNVHYEANEVEIEHQWLHCYLEVSFRNIAKIIIQEIDINKADYTL